MISKELEIGRSDLTEAVDGLSRQAYKWTTIQAYYAIFHGMRALLFAAELREESHLALRVAIHELYVATGKLNRRFEFLNEGDDDTLRIDDAFITYWHPRYIEAYKTDDEPDYQRLLPVVATEIDTHKTLSKETFTRILHWKSPRLKGIVRLHRYETDYAPTIRRAVEQTDDMERLPLLTALHRIATPTASTILQYIYPDRFPIMNIRTVEILNMAELLLNTKRDDANGIIPARQHHRPCKKLYLAINPTT